MPVKPQGQSTPRSPLLFEIKSAQLPLVALLLKSAQWEEVIRDLQSQFGELGENPGFFDQDPVVLDFSGVPRDLALQELPILTEGVRSCRLRPLAFRAEPEHWTAALQDAGLVQAAPDAGKLPRSNATEAVETIREVVREVASPSNMIIDKPMRSGQKVYARGGDLVVLAMVNQGAEIVADGNIHVYAPLRGKAMAGARGNAAARIFSTCLEPELVSIAGVYRTSENPLPDSVAGKPAQIRLNSEGGQDKLLFEPLNA